MGTHPIFESDFDCLTEGSQQARAVSDGERWTVAAMGEVDKLRLALETFCSTKSDDSLVDDIPDDLEKILEQIALSGELPWQMSWKQIGFLVRRKILYCINEMNTAKKFTGSAEEYTDTMDLIVSRVELFEDAPFTIQRLCELLLEPQKHYTSTDKYMRALLKNLLVVSGWRRQPESDLPDETECAKDESKVEIQQPDSTSESTSTKSNPKSPPRSRDDSMGSDSENQQPDSTTQEPKNEEKQQNEEPDNFMERPKSRNDDEEESDVFDTMKNNSPKRKVAVSTQKIQIQVGVGKGVPASEAEKTEETPDSPATNQVSSSSENEAAAVENSVDGEGTEEKPSSTEEPPSSNQTPPAPTESERKRKRSSENQPEGDCEASNAPVTEESSLTPQKLQKTEWPWNFW